MALTTKLSLIVLPLASACAALPSPAPQYYAQYQTTLMIDAGRRSLDNAFEPVDDQSTLGIELDIRQPNASVGLEVGLFYSSADKSQDVAGIGKVDYESSMIELSVGGRWYHDSAFLFGRPYAAAGASLLLPSYSAEPNIESDETGSDWAIGPYFRVGMEWAIGGHASIAIDYRQVLFANVIHDVDLGNSFADANYQQVGLVVGWAF
jgi:hypothetical protein